MATFDLDDPIAAPASAPGPAARAIVRVSGAGGLAAVASVFRPDEPRNLAASRVATHASGRITADELAIDFPAEVYVWPTGRSYTGQPLAELHLPGSPPLVEATLAALYRAGVRPARPGEFTLRAFLAGRLDLVRAEAVLGVIDAGDDRELDLALRQLGGGLSGRLGAVRSDLLSLLADLEAGLDFVEEGIEFVGRDETLDRLAAASAAIDGLLADAGARWRDAGRTRVVLAGLPNAGKSTLFNALAGGDRALVSPVAGTTRDWLTAEVDLDGTSFELVDTAGWEAAADNLAAAMQTLRTEQLDRADLILWCRAADAAPAEAAEDAQLRDALGPLKRKTVVVATKLDLAAEGRQPPGRPMSLAPAREADPLYPQLAVSAVTGEGLNALQARLAAEASAVRPGGRAMIGSTAARGRESLETTRDALGRAADAAAGGYGDEIVAAELRAALDGLAAVLGAVYTDDVLDVIFSRFCIGK